MVINVEKKWLLGVLFLLFPLLQSYNVLASVSHLFDCEILNIELYLEVNAIRQYYWRCSKILPHNVSIILNRRNNQSSKT